MDATLTRLIPLAAALLLAPLLPGLAQKTKALFAGRQGPPVLQLYYDLRKLLAKGAVYSRTVSWVFRVGPMAALAALITAAVLLPLGPSRAALAFHGDLLLFAGMLAVARCGLVLAALDTGSSFEGMGASREVQFSALAEPALLLCLAAVARMGGDLSLSSMLPAAAATAWTGHAPALVLVGAGLAVVLLAENSRIPFDDPNTHLELTMVHEVMVLDHGGPDYAFLLYAAALKLWVLAALLVGVVLPPCTGYAWLDTALSAAGVLAAAVGVGVVESAMARLRLLKLPQLLVGAAVLALLGLISVGTAP